MASVAMIGGGRLLSVYDDRWRSILESIGTLEVQRASEVEFDSRSGDWVAHEIATGREIGRSRVRADCIRQEVSELERSLLR